MRFADCGCAFSHSGCVLSYSGCVLLTVGVFCRYGDDVVCTDVSFRVPNVTSFVSDWSVSAFTAAYLQVFHALIHHFNCFSSYFMTAFIICTTLFG